MDKEKIKSIYFLAVGAFSIYPWNAILNLNDFFAESFDNPDISKIYTLGYFILSIPAFYTTIYIDKHYSIYTSIKITFLTVLICFNLLYFVCQYLPNNLFKYVLFSFLMIMIGNCDILVGNLSTGLSSRFSGNENSYNYLGKAFSGLFCNFIMLVDLLLTRTSNNKLIYLVFLVIGDIFIAFFLFIQERVFNLMKSNQYIMKADQEDDLTGTVNRNGNRAA